MSALSWRTETGLIVQVVHSKCRPRPHHLEGRWLRPRTPLKLGEVPVRVLRGTAEAGLLAAASPPTPPHAPRLFLVA